MVSMHITLQEMIQNELFTYSAVQLMDVSSRLSRLGRCYLQSIPYPLTLISNLEQPLIEILYMC